MWNTRRMDSIGEKIRFLRESKKITQAALAKLVNVAAVTVSKWELDVSKPKGNSVVKLASTFRVTIATFIQHKNKIEYVDQNIISIPFFPNVEAAAGCGYLPSNEKSEFIRVPEDLVRNCAYVNAITVKGDSMEPVFTDRSCIFIDKSQVDIEDGKVFVFIHDDMIRMKILERIPHGIRIKSYNPNYPTEDINLRTETVHIIGKVVAQIQKYS